jgi:hypothetical protein
MALADIATAGAFPPPGTFDEYWPRRIAALKAEVELAVKARDDVAAGLAHDDLIYAEQQQRIQQTAKRCAR